MASHGPSARRGVAWSVRMITWSLCSAVNWSTSHLHQLAPFSRMQHVAQHFLPADLLSRLGGGAVHSVVDQHRVIAGTNRWWTIGWRRSRGWTVKNGCVFRNALAGIFGRFSLFYNYLWFCKSISRLTPMTSHPWFLDLQGIPGHLSPLQHFCNHFQFWNSTSSLSLRTENAAPTMLSH